MSSVENYLIESNNRRAHRKTKAERIPIRCLRTQLVFLFLLLHFIIIFSCFAGLSHPTPPNAILLFHFARNDTETLNRRMNRMFGFFFLHCCDDISIRKEEKTFFFHYLFACRALCLSSIEAFYLTFNRNNLFSIVVVVVPLHHYFFLARMRSFFVRRVFHVSSKETVQAQQQQRAYTRMWILIWECCTAHSGMIVSQLKRALPPLLCLYYNDFEGIYKKANTEHTHTPRKQSNRPNFVFIAFRRILSMRRQTNKNRHKKASSSEEIANNYIYLLFFA